MKPLKHTLRLLASVVMLSSVSWSLPDLPDGSVVFDDEVEMAFDLWFSKIFKAAPQFSKTLKPKVFLIAHHTVNAGAGAGGQFAIFSGLFKQCETIEEFMGVIAHEIAHVKGSHMIRGEQAASQNMLVAAIAFALGGVAALASGDMAPLIAGLSGGSGMYMGSVLKHTRDLETQADADAVDLLTRAGIPATGLLSFLQKLEKLYRSPDVNPYHQTHPLTSDRISALKDRIATLSIPVWSDREQWQSLYTHVRAKILAFTLRPKEVLNLFKGDSAETHMARAIALGRQNQTEEAIRELEKAIQKRAHDPFILEIKAQLLLDKRDVNGAITSLEKAISMNPKRSIYLKLSLAHLLTEKGNNPDKALGILKEITQRSSEGNEFGWYLLGKSYAQKGLPGHALWASAEYDLRQGDIKASEAKLKRVKGYLSTEPDLKIKMGDSKVDLREEKEARES